MKTGSSEAEVFAEADLIPISALQHHVFCPRQCGLIHVDRLWAENRLTVEGRHLHEKAHGGKVQTRAGVRTTRTLALRSLMFGLIGQADIVEWPKAGPPVPVEYKRGKPKQDASDAVQLCAQAMCLEEMLDVSIPEAAIFYGQTRRRQPIALDEPLREQTRGVIMAVRSMIQSGHVPPAVYEKKCRNCSLREMCLPRGKSTPASASDYLRRSLAQMQQTAPVSDAEEGPMP